MPVHTRKSPKKVKKAFVAAKIHLKTAELKRVTTGFSVTRSSAMRINEEISRREDIISFKAVRG